MKWFDRSFTFDLPIAAFPTVLERVRGTPARLEELIASIPFELWTAEPLDGWSIQEHVGHLSDLDELHEARLEDYDARAERLRPADLQNRKTEEAGHNRAAMEELLARFRAGRAAFVARLDGMNETQIARTALHPRLEQPMRVIDMAVFVADHDDHHMARIRELARSVKGVAATRAR
ncbi:MAG: DinB family protein [Longimicrobiales bacterium]